MPTKTHQRKTTSPSPLTSWMATHWRGPDESLERAIARLIIASGVCERTIQRGLSGAPLRASSALALAAVDPKRLDAGKLALGALARREERAA